MFIWVDKSHLFLLSAIIPAMPMSAVLVDPIFLNDKPAHRETATQTHENEKNPCVTAVTDSRSEIHPPASIFQPPYLPTPATVGIRRGPAGLAAGSAARDLAERPAVTSGLSAPGGREHATRPWFTKPLGHRSNRSGPVPVQTGLKSKFKFEFKKMENSQKIPKNTSRCDECNGVKFSQKFIHLV